MKGGLRCILMVLLAALFAGQGVGRAQDGNDSLETVITLDYRDTNLREVLDYVARKSRRTIVIEPDVDETITISLIEVPWRKALDIICQQAGVFYRADGNTFTIYKPPHVTMNLRDADIRMVIELISKLSNANIIVAENVQGNVNVHLKDIPWDIALDNVVKTANFTLVKEEGGILRVVAADSLQTQMESSVFQLRYIYPPERYKAKIASEFTDYLKPDLTAANDPEQFALFKALKSISSAGGNLSYEPERNIIIAKDTVPVLNQMKDIVSRYDLPPRQVYVEVRFIRTTNTDALDYGVQWTNGFNVTNSLGSTVTRLPFNLGRSGFEDHLAVRKDGPSEADISRFLETTLPYTFGTLDFRQTTTALRLLKQTQDTEIVQAPALLALDNQEATIFVGETIRWVEQEVSTDQFGNPTISLKEAEDSPVAVGFQLLVRPHIVPESEQVILSIIPRFETLTGTGENIPGFDTFISAGASLDLPRVGSETVVTKMLLEDGQTGVIGGLLNTQTTKREDKVPFIGDIPFLGRLFRFNGSSVDSRNLIIFVTPHIMRTKEETRKRLEDAERKRQDAILQEQMDRMDKLNRDDSNLNSLDDVRASGNGILSPEEIQDLLRKYRLEKK